VSTRYRVTGLDNAGKTTTLYQLHLGQAVVSNPTVGSNVEQVKHRNLTFEARAARGLRLTPYPHVPCQLGFDCISCGWTDSLAALCSRLCGRCLTLA